MPENMNSNGRNGQENHSYNQNPQNMPQGNYNRAARPNPNGQRMPNPNGQRRPNPNAQRRPQQNGGRKPQATESVLSPTVKGIIAVMLTFLIVAIVILVFAKTLFVTDNSEPKKTGVITSTEYVAPVTTTTEEVKETKKTTKNDDDDDDDDVFIGEGEDGNTQEIQCTSAVYLHPEANSSSANLATIPAGATVTFYRNDNGWYYVKYNDIVGYAWNTFFTAPTTTTTTTAYQY